MNVKMYIKGSHPTNIRDLILGTESVNINKL